ncbi:hypothetical protein [Burkholderia cenocepacia]|uniref:hypothetical protein n=1 Tax=Burkholderia cenocepacia TaxID=95486 RepID=UPI00076191B1|nr:hypothetical protein [Burkholderia cenocepacia]KWU26407.1 hypothetical protein AS149_25810 [Burkholderia cenocepacia]
MHEATLADFRQATQTALTVQSVTAHYALRTPAFYIARICLFYLLGAITWVISPHPAAAIAVTSILYSVWHSFALALYAKRFAKGFVIQLSEEDRVTASRAWDWLSYLRSVRDVRFLGLTVGMSATPALTSIWSGHPVSNQGLHFVVLDACAMSAILVCLARTRTLVAPLLKRLRAPTPDKSA